ncbi:MAG: hypothetical protein JNM78_11505 [Cyclobacteriaceae bacterium]|nr:hypothetical protein [Cyclobacteriaceae bacterium]
MKKIFVLLLCVLLASKAISQFRATAILGLNNTSIGSSATIKLPTSRQLTGGLEIETLLRGKHLRSAYLSLNTGAFYLKNGFEESYYYTFFGGDKKPIYSSLETSYLMVPLQGRLYLQPLPLIESWTIFIGGGVSANLLLDASLNELTVEETFGSGVKTYSDNKNIKNYGEKYYLFSVLEIGMMIKRFKIIFRQKKSLQDMYFSGLDGNWKIPPDRSTYMINHKATGKLTERHIEILVGFTFMK